MVKSFFGYMCGWQLLPLLFTLSEVQCPSFVFSLHARNSIGSYPRRGLFSVLTASNVVSQKFQKA